MNPIEYIGPSPQKPTKKSWAGGWLMIILVVVSVGFVAKPFVIKALAQNEGVTALKVEETAAWLRQAGAFGDQLAIAALERTQGKVVYDAEYYQLSYPNGDIPSDRGLSSCLLYTSPSPRDRG